MTQLACILILVASASVGIADGAEAVSCHAKGCLEDDVSGAVGLLQSASQARKVVAADGPLPTLRPLGRSYYSQDPKASAQWFMRYFGGEPDTELPDLAAHELGADMAAVIRKTSRDGSFGNYRVLFIKGKEMKPSYSELDSFVHAVEKEWSNVMDRKQQYTPWTDFHDGLSWQVLNLTNLREDRLRFQSYNDVQRFIWPNTTWTLELVRSNSDDLPTEKEPYGEHVQLYLDDGYPDKDAIAGETGAQRANVDYYLDNWFDDPDSCRDHNSEFDRPNSHRLWWKTTYAVRDAEAASDFAAKVLGAELHGSPFPWPPVEGCTAARWTRLLQPGEDRFDLHFVESTEYPSGSRTIEEYHHHLRSLSDSIAKGCFDPALYTSILLETDTLDPFVERLTAQKVPFLPLLLGPSRYALVFTFTGNEGVVVHLLGKVLTKAEARPVQVC